MAGASLRVGANTSEFTSQMKSMLTQMKLVTSEYKVEAAQAKALGSQTDLLKAKKTELTSKIKLQTDAIKLQQTNLTAQKQKLTELIEKEDKAKQKVAELTKAHEDSVKATGKDSEESQKLNAQLEEAKEAHAKATNAVKKQEDAIAKNTVKLNESKAALTEQNTALKNTEEELTNAEKKWTVFGQEIKTAGSNMDEAGNKTISLGDVIKANLISSAIINGVKELANGIKELAKGAISVGMDFESGMSQVAATMGMTTQEIAGGSEAYTKLENAAKEAGNTTQFSATQAAEALNYMALAGYDADKAVETLPTVLNLAAAGGMDLATASDMVTDSMSALGDKAGTTESFVDKMAKTSQKSNTSVQQLGEALLSVGGTAKSLAGGVTEANTVLGIFADSGTKGAEGGTALRNVILSLTAPTDTAKKKMQELGLKVFDANGNMRPLNETFQDLNGILGNMTQGEQTEVLNTIFNKVDLKSVNALLANSGERFNELSGYIENSTGAAEQMAATMNDNLQGKITILKSGLEGLGIAAYEKFETPLKNAVTNITNVIGDLQTDLTSGELSGALDKVATGFGNLVEKASEIIVAVLPKILEGLGWIADHGDTIASLLAAIGAGFAVFKVASIINGVVTAIQGLTAAEVALNAIQKLVNITMAANPMMLIITLVATLVAAIVGFVATNEDARAAVVNAWNIVKDTVGKVVGEIAKFFTETIPNALSKVVDFVKDNWQDILLFLANPFAGAAKLLYEHCETFQNIVDNIASFFRELPGKIWDAILGAVEKITTWGENVKTAATQAASNAITSVVTFFQELPGKIWDAILGAVTTVTTWGENMKADVEVLGKYEDHAEAQFTVANDSIEAEVKRAEGIEDELRSSIQVNANKITSKVEKGDMGSYITQYYNNVLVAFNNSSKYVQISAGQIAIYNGEVTTKGKRAVFDQSGNAFYRDNYFVGRIGTNEWKSNSAHKGLTFDLEYQGKYMAWAQEESSSATSYDTILCYSRANSIYTEKGLHFGCNMYAHGWNLYNADLRNTSYDGYTSWSGSIPIITKIQANSDGTITWWSSSITVRNGGITSAPSS